MLTAAIIMTAGASALLILFPAVAESAVTSSLELTVNRVIPSLFCFMVLSKFASSIDAARILRPLFKPVTKLLRLSNDEAGCFITGNLCGFPAGAAMCSDLIEEKGYKGARAVTLTALSNNISIGFMTSFVGKGLFGSMRVGAMLWLCQLLSAIIVNGVIRRKIEPADSVKKRAEDKIDITASLVSAVKDGSASALYLTGFIVTFSVIASYAEMLISSLGAPSYIMTVVSSVLEVSRGCALASSLGEPYSIILIAFSAAHSGLCVIFQSAVFFVRRGVRISHYAGLKLLQGILSALISLLLYSLFM